MSETTRWDQAFFERFVAIRNRIYRDNPFALPETLADYGKLLRPEAPFHRNNHWKAWILAQDGVDVGRVLVSYPKSARREKLPFSACGYFECERSSIAARALFGYAWDWTQGQGLGEMRGPIQGNFFNSYRLKLPGGRRPFYGEPICPDYYPELYLAGGFRELEVWDTIQVLADETLKGSQEIRRRFWGSELAADFSIRSISLTNWREELRTVHRLFTESYSGMTCFMPISFEEFYVLYEPMKYLALKDLVLFIEHKGQPVAFMIAYFDPLRILLAHEKMPAFIPGPIKRLATLIRLRRNRQRILVVYVGKVDPPTGEIKGVTGALVEKLAEATKKFPQTYPLVCYLAKSSPTYASLPKNMRTYSSYALYQKTS